MTFEELREEVRQANLALVGLGEELPEEAEAFYQKLAELLEKKDYFIVTLNGREELEGAGLLPERITAPFSEGEPEESWENYLHWLSYTLNQNLCILELGVGFAKPQVIRFPFERTAYFNRKARYVRISKNFPQLSEEIAGRGISVHEDPLCFFGGAMREGEEEHG